MRAGSLRGRMLARGEEVRWSGAADVRRRGAMAERRGVFVCVYGRNLCGSLHAGYKTVQRHGAANVYRRWRVGERSGLSVCMCGRRLRRSVCAWGEAMHGGAAANVRRQRRLASGDGVRRRDDLCHGSLWRVRCGVRRLRQQRGQRLRDEHQHEHWQLRGVRDSVQRDERHGELHRRAVWDCVQRRVWELRWQPVQRLRDEHQHERDELRSLRDSVQWDERYGDL